MFKSCKWCGRMHPVGEECTQRPKRVNMRTAARRLRSSNQWTEKSRKIRERDGYLCRVCRDNGVIVWANVEVHHIIPLNESDAYAFDDEWLISLCRDCHEAAERGDLSREYLHTLALTGVPPGSDSEKR